MTVNNNNNDSLDEPKNNKSGFFLQDLLEFDKNIFISFGLLAIAIYLINKLTSSNISQDVQGFLVVIIGLLIIVAIDFLKKENNTTNSDVKIPYPKIENHHQYNYDYSGSIIYQNSQNTHYSSKGNLEEVAAEIKEIIEKVSQNKTNSDVKEMPIIEAEFIEKIKHNEPEITKDLTDKDLSIVAKTIETIEQDKPFKQKVISALKAGSIAALEDMLDNPYISIIEEVVKGWKENETDINNLDIKSQNKNSE
ncbi:MAG: hypothetical protein QNJ33_09370 [Crocosphaera sp.]|nr:hypothetical protein [Crocosphaera sp.]